MLREESGKAVLLMPDVQRSAEAIVEAALSYCVDRGVCNCTETLVQMMQQGNATAHDYFRRALAEQVADYLARVDENVRAAYCYRCGALADEMEADEPGVTSEAPVLLHVHRRTAALSSMIAALDQAMVSYYRTNLVPAAKKMRYLLDVQVIDDDDVRDGRGLAGLLTSIYSKPVKIWER